MKKYTKLFLATLCFISSAPVLADGYKGEAPPLPCVTIPNFNGGFEFTIGAIYMQPTSTNLTYLGINRVTTVPGVPSFTASSWNDNAINPGYDWGFVLGFGYVFPNTANDVKVDWMYFHNNYSNSTALAGLLGVDTTVISWPLDSHDLFASDLLTASATMDYDFDAVDLTFGQYFNIGPRLQSRLFAGLRYMRLNSDLTTSTAHAFEDDDIPSADFTTGVLNSSFNGIGPLFGMRSDYYLGAGFGLSGMFDAALLVGNLSFSGNEFDTAGFVDDGVFTLTSSTLNDLNWDSQNIVAPGFDAKFGLNYKYQFNNGTLLGLELGYQVTKYIDVIEQLDRGGTTLPANFDTDVTNFGLNGPYLTLNVKI